MPVGKVGVSLHIKLKLLTDVEERIEGRNRSDKLCKCIEIGYEKLTQNSAIPATPHGEVQAPA